MDKPVQIPDIETVTTIGSYMGLFGAFFLGAFRMFKRSKPQEKSVPHLTNVECPVCSKEQEMEAFAREISRLSDNMDEMQSTVATQGEQISQIREDMGFVRGLLEAKFQTKVRK
jgi:hypothetical protein